MENFEPSTADYIDNDILSGMGNPYSVDDRLDYIHRAANSTSSLLEAEAIKNNISEAVKNLDKETGEMFADKKDVVKTTLATEDKAEVNSEKSSDDIDDNKIFGMSPLTFGLVAIGVGVAGYLAYQKFKK